MSEGFLKDQKLRIEDDGKVVLTNTFNTDDLDRELAEERKHTQESKEFHKVCSIPSFEFQIDPLLKKYVMYCEAHDGTEARKALRQFLALNPQYLASTDKF
jgi:hypothetical protein